MFGIEDYSKPIVDFGNFDISQFGTALGFGGAMLLIGMLTVFAVLVLLWGCLTIFKMAFHDLPAKRANTAIAQPETPAPIAPGVQTVAEDGEIVAVIAAAIAMAESESSDVKFKVVSFRRK